MSKLNAMENLKLSQLEAIMAEPDISSWDALIFDLSYFVVEQMELRIKEFIKKNLPKEFNGEPTDEWLEKFYADEADIPVANKFIDEELDNAIRIFWQTHPRDLIRLPGKEKSNITKMAMDICLTRDSVDYRLKVSCFHELIKARIKRDKLNRNRKR